MEGDVKEIVIIKCLYWFDDIVVINCGEFIYSDFDGGIVNIFRSGRVEILIIVLLGWKLYRLCCIKFGGILVSMFSGRYNKIICYEEN